MTEIIHQGAARCGCIKTIRVAHPWRQHYDDYDGAYSTDDDGVTTIIKRCLTHKLYFESTDREIRELQGKIASLEKKQREMNELDFTHVTTS